MEKKQSAPEPLVLSKAYKNALQPHLKKFATNTKTPQFNADLEDRRNQIGFFQQEFSTRLPDLAESDLIELLTHLWATRIWSNKQYLAQKIISTNGIEKLKAKFERLRNTRLSVADRYEDFLENISYLGPAAVTEMMCYVEPHRCGIWNEKARSAFKIMAFDTDVSPSKYRISGKEYETFNRLLAAIAGELEKAGLKDVDLLIVDYFLYEVATAVPEKEEKTTKEVTAGHDEIRDMIEAIGAMLGFDTDIEFSIAHGAKVDVVWRARIGNLGVVTYVFEVQKSGSIDSLILNLQKAKNSPTVQKVIAVSDGDQLQRIERETDGLQTEFRNSLALWKISEVQQVSQNLQAASEIINRLGLVPGKS